MEKGHSLHCIKMGADSLAYNTPNDPEFICPKVLDFNRKRLPWRSEVRAHCPKSPFVILGHEFKIVKLVFHPRSNICRIKNFHYLSPKLFSNERTNFPFTV